MRSNQALLVCFDKNHRQRIEISRQDHHDEYLTDFVNTLGLSFITDCEPLAEVLGVAVTTTIEARLEKYRQAEFRGDFVFYMGMAKGLGSPFRLYVNHPGKRCLGMLIASRKVVDRNWRKDDIPTHDSVLEELKSDFEARVGANFCGNVFQAKVFENETETDRMDGFLDVETALAVMQESHPEIRYGI